MIDFLQIADPQNVAALIGVVVPLVVAFITKKVASSGLRGVLNLLVSAVAGSTAYLVTEIGAYDLEGFITAVVNTFIVSIVSYYGVYKPTGVTDSVIEATANFGFGRPNLQTLNATEPVEVPANGVAEEPNATLPETSSPAVGKVIEVDSLPVTFVLKPPVKAPSRRKRKRKTVAMKKKYEPKHLTVEEATPRQLPKTRGETSDVP